MSRDDLTEMEDLLKSAARSFNYPMTPDLAKSSNVIDDTTRKLKRSRLWAPAIVAFLLLCSIIFFVAPVRAAVLEFIQVGVIQIFTGEPEVDFSEAIRSETIYSLIAPLDGDATLLEAERALGLSGTLSQIVEGVGQPDRVYVQDLGGTAAILIWLSGEGESNVGMSLLALSSGAFLGKDAPITVTHTEVWGQDALWLTGDHRLLLKLDGDEHVIPVTGNILIWEYDGLTYRLETGARLDDALEMFGRIPD